MALTMHSRGKAALPANRSRATPRFTSLVAHASSARADERAAIPAFAGAALAVATFLSSASLASAAIPEKIKLPPVTNDAKSCEILVKLLTAETTGKPMYKPQATENYDLRGCSFRGADLHQKALVGALAVDVDMSGANLREAILTKAFAMRADFSNADMTAAVLNSVDFTGANLKGANLENAVITGANFAGADLTGVNFEDTLISQQDQKRLCSNDSLQGESREQIGCR